MDVAFYSNSVDSSREICRKSIESTFGFLYTNPSEDWRQMTEEYLTNKYFEKFWHHITMKFDFDEDGKEVFRKSIKKIFDTLCINPQMDSCKMTGEIFEKFWHHITMEFDFDEDGKGVFRKIFEKSFGIRHFVSPRKIGLILLAHIELNDPCLESVRKFNK